MEEYKPLSKGPGRKDFFKESSENEKKEKDFRKRTSAAGKTPDEKEALEMEKAQMNKNEMKLEEMVQETNKRRGTNFKVEN